MRFSKQGPKRRRYTRRELPYGQLRMWGKTVGNFKRERQARRDKSDEMLRMAAARSSDDV